MQSEREQIASSVKKGVRETFPVMLAYMSIGTTYGLLAQQSGLGLWAALGMSVLVYAGTSQFMAVSMLQSGVEALVIIGSVFMVNFRFLLLSAAVTPHLGGWKTWKRLLMGGLITDAVFALHSLNFRRGDMDPAAAVTLNVTAYVTWVIFSLVGYNLGAMIGNPKVWGLDFALPALFVGLLLSACGNKAGIAAAVVGGAVSVKLHLMDAGGWAAFLGALAGATAGVLLMKGGEDE